MINQNIEIKANQTLAMTPRLQQAIQLLQLSVVELNAYIQTQVEENPLLQKVEISLNNESNIEARSPNVDYNIDEDWKEGGGSEDTLLFGNGNSEEYDPLINVCQQRTLTEHLLEQLIIFEDPLDKAIGEFLIYHLNTAGFLEIELEEIAKDFAVDLNKVKYILSVMQGFEPTGVFAKNLIECFQLQLKERGLLSYEMDCFLDKVHMLTSHPLQKIAKAAFISVEKCHEFIKILRTLSPKPADGFLKTEPQILIADVNMKRNEIGEWTPYLNAEAMPHIIIKSDYYHDLKNKIKLKEDHQYMNERFSHAQWLVQSLTQRAQTLLLVSLEIVRHQQAFFDHGYNYFKPLNLKKIAEALNIHESTVSRITTSKYISTPRGIFSLKFFFSSSVSPLYENEAVSSKRIQEAIRNLVRSEATHAPLSDDAIVVKLDQMGLNVARRTINKYRKILCIPSSTQRKRFYELNPETRLT